MRALRREVRLRRQMRQLRAQNTMLRQQARPASRPARMAQAMWLACTLRCEQGAGSGRVLVDIVMVLGVA